MEQCGDGDEHRGWQETAYLLRSLTNARALMDSIAELDAGGGRARRLIGADEGE
ncbi:hypothetical protein [Streptomyces sp. enrichment culture]|uniref:hypothetical protein n=1 Tax=Streptomyces sp. enrichment culture TaxID=1795815 RepID=UPI003F5747BB